MTREQFCISNCSYPPQNEEISVFRNVAEPVTGVDICKSLGLKAYGFQLNIVDI